MQPKDPLEIFFDQLEETLFIAQDAQGKLSGSIPPEMLPRVERLLEDLELFCRVGETTLKNLPIREERVTEVVTDWEHLPSRERKLLQKAQDLKDQIEAMERNMNAAVSILKQKGEGMGKPGNESLTRQKKFRRVGGKKGWKPL